MSLAHAHALLKTGQVCVQPHDPARDAKALYALASWAMRFSPLVAVDPPDGLLLDITGCQRLFHGERRLVNALANSVEWLGVRTRVASASTFGCAWAAARFGRDDRVVIPDGAGRDALASLPVEALRIDDETAEALREVGVECIGHVLDLPRLELVARFGGDVLLRLDQALGEAQETIDPLRPRERIAADRTFDGPVKQLEAILITVRSLVGELSKQLRQRERGVRRLSLHMARSDAGPIDEAILLSRAMRDEPHLWMLLRPKVENANLGFGIERITLTADDTARLHHAQAQRWRDEEKEDGSPIDQRLGRFVDTLIDRLGPQRAMRAEMVEAHLPEGSFRFRSTMGASSRGSGGGLKRAGGRTAVQVADGARPSMLLAEPERIRVIAEYPEGPPSWFSWRGEAHHVLSGAGPERLAPPWWKDDARSMRRGRALRAGSDRQWHRSTMDPAEPSRDYFRIQDDAGRWLWVYRELETGRWFVHGQWA